MSHCLSSLASLICCFPLVVFIDAIKDKITPHTITPNAQGVILVDFFFWGEKKKNKKTGLGSATGSAAVEILVKMLMLSWALVAFRAPGRVGVWGLKQPG